MTHIQCFICFSEVFIFSFTCERSGSFLQKRKMASGISLTYQMSPLIILLKELVAFYIVMRKEKHFLEIMGLCKVWKELNENTITHGWK